jgi:DNA-nicking Smr family endonuclease
MSLRKKQTDPSMRRSRKNESSSENFYTPFEKLDQHLAQSQSMSSRLPRVPNQRVPNADQENDEEMFLKAMSDVTPLDRSHHERVPPAPPTKTPPRFLNQEEWEVYTHLVDLVSGDAPFEMFCSDEYVEGFVLGLSPEILKKLRCGELSYQEYIDLHGYNRQQAHDVVTRFIHRSFTRGHRCVLIVSGRGLNSREKQPILKQSLVTWLTRAPLKRLVLAFASARPYDGGAGALYVILRRNKGKVSFVRSFF